MFETAYGIKSHQIRDHAENSPPLFLLSATLLQGRATFILRVGNFIQCLIAKCIYMRVTHVFIVLLLLWVCGRT